ncbi:universal stress protein [Propionivibrio limicola]|uniref:universal stress protein n=1 Tax=Propionivibrio limicola TaxID=167645 RepID=UPI001290BDE7|nr:universal stress protein [Propionivibrio limicola]
MADSAHEKITSIVAATDLSTGANMAVESAAQLARQWHADLCLLHVFNDSLWASLQSIYDTGEWGGEAARTTAQQRLAQLSDDIARRFDIAVRHEFRSGRATAQIAEFVKQQDAQLLVVGEHGENWIGDTVVGGTALKVLEQAALPVLLARRPSGAGYTNVLIATDYSDNALRAARLALDLFPDAQHTFLNAYLVQFEGRMRLAGATDADIERYREDERKFAEKGMREFRSRLGITDDERPPSRLYHAFPATAIFELSEKTGTDLIVMGKHGGSAVEERLLGSITQNILYHASCDVLLVP